MFLLITKFRMKGLYRNSRRTFHLRKLYNDKSCLQRSLSSGLCLGAGPRADYEVQQQPPMRQTTDQSKVHAKSPVRIKRRNGQRELETSCNPHQRDTYRREVTWSISSRSVQEAGSEAGLQTGTPIAQLRKD